MKLKSVVFLLVFIPWITSCATSPERFDFGSYSEGERLYNKGEYQKAIEHYQAYLNEQPQGSLAVIAEYYIAKSYAAMGDLDEAKKRYQKIVQENPGIVWANFAENQLKEIETRGK